MKYWKTVLMVVGIAVIAISGVALAQDLSGATDPVSSGPTGLLQTIQAAIYTVMQIRAKVKDPNFRSSFKSKEFLITALGMILTTIQQIIVAAVAHSGSVTP